jgi:uncharacterized protein with GYD domain
MSTYILLMTLTPEGQKMAMADPDYILRIESEIENSSVTTLGVYAVLGEYDFVTIVEADSNESMARFSIQLGVRAGVHITTMPVVPAARLSEEDEPLSAGVALEERPEATSN